MTKNKTESNKLQAQQVSQAFWALLKGKKPGHCPLGTNGLSMSKFPRFFFFFFSSLFLGFH